MIDRAGRIGQLFSACSTSTLLDNEMELLEHEATLNQSSSASAHVSFMEKDFYAAIRLISRVSILGRGSGAVHKSLVTAYYTGGRPGYIIK